MLALLLGLIEQPREHYAELVPVPAEVIAPKFDLGVFDARAEAPGGNAQRDTPRAYRRSIVVVDSPAKANRRHPQELDLESKPPLGALLVESVHAFEVEGC